MDFQNYTKFKTVYYSGYDIQEWVNKSIPSSKNITIGGGKVVSSVQKVNLFNKSSNVVGLSLADTTSYNVGNHEYATYKLTYFFDEGSISFSIDVKDSSSSRVLNPGKYVLKIDGGTGVYINLTGYVVFEVSDNKKQTRKVKFYKE